MAQGKSNVWKFFKICSDDEKKAECSLCEASQKKIMRGKTPKLFSTKPLWNHLKSKHPLAIENMDGNTDPETDPPTLNLNSSSSISHSKSHQPTLQSLIKKKEMWSLDDPKAMNITKKICEMMALDAEPFALVERKGFQRLIKYLAPQYPLPCRTYFSEKIMPRLYENLKTCIKEKLITAINISFSTDIWTSPANNESFISLTAHFIRSDDMHREILVLSAKHFPDSHTGFNIGQILNDVMEEWHISSSQIHLILRDNACNMIIGTDMLGESVGCFIHTLQLVIHDCIFKNRNFVEILGKCRKIVGHFSHSSLACSKLKNIQENLKLPIHKLIQDVTTRWNSTFYMLSRLHEQRQAVTAYAAEKDIPSLTAMQWNMVENVIRVLQPFEEMTKMASLNCETIGYVIPAIVTLHSYLSKRQKDTGVMMLKEDLKKAMEERFLNPIGLNVKDQKCFVLATVLDPRFKTKFCPDENKAKQWIIEELLEVNKRVTNDTENNTQSHNVSSLQERNVISETHEDIWKCFDDIVNNSKSDTDNSNLDDSESISFERQPSERSKKKTAVYNAELAKYLVLPLSPRNEDPLIWWKIHALEYPNLKILVIKYLSAPPSSVNSERLFSAGKLVYSDDRNRLSPQNAEMLLFIMKNLLILNYNF